MWGHTTFHSRSVEQTCRESLLCARPQAAFACRAPGELGHFHSLLHTAASRASQVGALAEASAGGALKATVTPDFQPKKPTAQESPEARIEREIKAVVDIRGKTRLPV